MEGQVFVNLSQDYVFMWTHWTFKNHGLSRFIRKKSFIQCNAWVAYPNKIAMETNLGIMTGLIRKIT